MINVRFARLPGAINPYVLNDGNTVSDLLDVAETELRENEEIRLNGTSGSMDSALHEGDVVNLVTKIIGNAADYIEIRVARLPGALQTIGLNGGRTVADALDGANLTLRENEEIRVNGSAGNMETSLNTGDSIVLVTKIIGN